jgi:hypothetical protein
MLVCHLKGETIMTYKDRFVVEVKHNGKIMRVRDGFVTLPFGSEYSLLLKNLNSRRALVNISIDGQDILDGNSLVINANQTTELEGFMKGNIASNKFKFIKKTKEIQDHRGDKIDDGMIRVEFAYEVEEPVRIRRIINEHHEHHHHHHHHDDWWWPRPLRWTYTGDAPEVYYSNSADSRGIAAGSKTFNASFNNSVVGSADAPENLAENINMQDLSTPIDDMGITVKGNEIHQNFSHTWIGKTDPSQVIIINLKGTDSQGQAVQQPVTVKTKLTCSSCGRNYTSMYKFCPNCGTFLE